MRMWRKTERFIRDNLSYGGEDCLIWPYGRDRQGYARATAIGFTTRLAHRIICELVHGPAPAGKSIARHLCGKGHLGCVHPRHLAWGTPTENEADKELHGTKPNGTKSSMAVLCADAVAEIRKLQRDGMSQRSIATIYSVSPGTIQAVIERRTWKHV